MAEIVGTGVDLVEVERVEQALVRAGTGVRFGRRVYTEGERSYCESRGKGRFQSYAARFAAKEAVMKALGTGWSRNAGWHEIEVVRERGHAPKIVLSGKAAAFAHKRGIKQLHLSISHTAEHAIAHVIAEG
jgi:holo-[acyl-carrier protein] synthase